MIQDSGNLKPPEFHWSGEPSLDSRESVSQLNFTGTGFYFTFDYGAHRREYVNTLSPGQDQTEEIVRVGSWLEVRVLVNHWLRFLHREVSTPDPWLDLPDQDFSQVLMPSDEPNNEKFNEPEANRIEATLETIRTEIKQMRDFSTEQQEFLDAKVDYLIDALKRQGRFDWAHTVIGVIVTVVTALALTPDQANTIWMTLRKTFDQVVLLLK